MTEVVRPSKERYWRLTDEKINDIQVQSIDHLIKRAKAAHFVNVRVRINGKWEEFEADWIKHLKPVFQPASNGLIQLQRLIRRIPASVTPDTFVEVLPSVLLQLAEEFALSAPEATQDSKSSNGDDVLQLLMEAHIHQATGPQNMHTVKARDCITKAIKLYRDSAGPEPHAPETPDAPTGECNRRNVPGDPCDRNCNWPECGCVPDSQGVMHAPKSGASDDA